MCKREDLTVSISSQIFSWALALGKNRTDELGDGAIKKMGRFAYALIFQAPRVTGVKWQEAMSGHATFFLRLRYNHLFKFLNLYLITVL